MIMSPPCPTQHPRKYHTSFKPSCFWKHAQTFRWHDSTIQEGMTAGWGGECSSAGCSTLRSCCELYLQLLLQVAVDFEAVVARIGHHDVSVGGERQPLWAVQRVCRRVDV